jgi:hypothetical protein
LIVEDESFTSFTISGIFASFKVKKLITNQGILVRKTTNERKKKRHEWGWGWKGTSSNPGQSL